MLRVEGTISGSRDPTVYPIVTQQPLDEAYRAPYMLNRQRQALISAYFAQNVSVVGSGTVDGNGWDWWYGVSHDLNGTYNRMFCRQQHHAPACTIQRPKLLEFVDCHDVLIAGTSSDEVVVRRSQPPPIPTHSRTRRCIAGGVPCLRCSSGRAGLVTPMLFAVVCLENAGGDQTPPRRRHTVRRQDDKGSIGCAGNPHGSAHHSAPPRRTSPSW